MDLSFPFFGAMGLEFRDPDGVQRILRQHIEPHMDEIESESNEAAMTMLGEIRESLLEGRGASFVTAVDIWFEDIFNWFPGMAWTLYKSEIHSVLGASRRGEDPLKLGDAADLFLEAFEGIDVSDMKAQIEATKAAALSPWDRMVYRTRRYDNDLMFVLRHVGGEDKRYPFTGIEGAVEQNRFQSAWERMLCVVPEHSLALLHEAVLLEGYQVSAPREMRRRLHWPDDAAAK